MSFIINYQRRLYLYFKKIVTINVYLQASMKSIRNGETPCPHPLNVIRKDYHNQRNEQKVYALREAKGVNEKKYSQR